jgi:hypothetical protein
MALHNSGIFKKASIHFITCDIHSLLIFWKAASVRTTFRNARLRSIRNTERYTHIARRKNTNVHYPQFVADIGSYVQYVLNFVEYY